jgi:phosphoglycerate dehydrogenase-like enzyme
MVGCFCGFKIREVQRIDYVFSEGRKEDVAKRVDLLDAIICKDNLETYRKQLQEVEVIFSTWGMETFTKEQIQTYFPRLKVVFYAAGSVQQFARPFLELGITIINASAPMAIPVAQMTLSLIIQLSKGFFLSETCYREVGYEEGRSLTIYKFPGLYAKTPVGILGVGRIGRTLIGYLKSFDVEVLVFDPFLSHEAAAELGVKKASLEEIFSTCQVISNHIANNVHTVGMLNYSLFSKMKANAAFINTGRGAQVVEQDLARAMQEEPLRYSVLDVTTEEPYPSNGILRTCSNILLLPHIAGFAASEVHCLSDCVIEQFDRYGKGEELENVVTMQMLDTMA